MRVHSDIYTFIEFFKKEEIFSRALVAQTDSGRMIKRPSKKYKQIGEILLKITEEYKTSKRGKLSFLKACAFSISSYNQSFSEENKSNFNFTNFPDLPLNIFNNISEDCPLYLSPSVQILQESPPLDVTFQIFSHTWHLVICSLLGLEVISAIYPGVPQLMHISHNHAPQSIPVIGDGNCLFRSISFLLTGSEDMHIVLRNMISIFINENTIHFHVHPEYISLSHMRENGIWGTETEIFAFASLLRSSIYVYSSVGTRNNMPRWLRFEPNINIPSPIPVSQFSLI